MGEWLTKCSIWLVIACYGLIVATACGAGNAFRLTRRFAWWFGALAFAIHIVFAFAVFYGWNWALAWQLTADQAEEFSGVRAGWGLWMNFAFGIAWIVLACREPRSESSGRSWIDRSLHAFIFFMVVMGGIAFAPLPARVFTSVVLICAVGCGLVVLRRQRQVSVSLAAAVTADHEN